MEMPGRYVIAGDIGGTKVLLALAEVTPEGVRFLHRMQFKSADFPDFATLVQAFLRALPAGHTPSAACFGVAGPIIERGSGQRVALTNLPWLIDTGETAITTGIDRVALINDFRAAGYGTEALRAEDLAVLQPGRPRPQAVRAIIGAGTGLGEGVLCWCGDRYEVLPTEGGHVDFAPTDELQIELWRYLRQKFPRVSYERVLSGAGLVAIYMFLRQRSGGPESPELIHAFAEGDPAAAISQLALSGDSGPARDALDLFVAIYGAQAGNLALTTLCQGGLFIAGGIAPKIIDKIRDGVFMRAFRAKGRMSALLDTIPVHVVVNEDVGLLGAALAAGRMQ